MPDVKSNIAKILHTARLKLGKAFGTLRQDSEVR
jgi:hypothetical protein